MTEFQVDEVIDGDTFSVKSGWKWKDQSGTHIRVTGYDTPEEGELGYQEAKNKLSRLILGKKVDVGPCMRVDRGRLVCDVYFQGKNLADYFSEYKSQS